MLRKKDFIIVNKTLGYIMNIEAKKTPTTNKLNSAREQLEGTKELIEEWFGGTGILKHFEYITIFFTTQQLPKDHWVEGHDIFWICGSCQVKDKLDKIHNSLTKNSKVPPQDFET